jgi:hypothetical protein
MKLFIVTSIKEHQPAVASIFRQAGISIFSLTETTGIRTERDTNLLDDWFGSLDGEYNSIILFSFTPEVKASKAMQLISSYNEDQHGEFPVRAFVLPVEQSSY